MHISGGLWLVAKKHHKYEEHWHFGIVILFPRLNGWLWSKRLRQHFHHRWVGQFRCQVPPFNEPTI